MKIDENIIIACTIYPKANRMAVENFCWTADSDAEANRSNLMDDARSYDWNRDTVSAIRYVLKKKRLDESY